MKTYRIERKLIKRPVPEYALSAVAYYYKSFLLKVCQNNRQNMKWIPSNYT